MTIYAAIAAAVFPALPQFAVGGPEFTGERKTEGDPATDSTVEGLAARTIYFIPAKLEDFQATFPGIQVFTAPFYGFAVAGTSIEAQDVFTDGTYTYLITGKPSTTYGFVLAPASQVDLVLEVGGGGETAGMPMGLLLSLTYAS